MAEEKTKSGSHEATVKAAGAEAQNLLDRFFKNINEQKTDEDSMDRFFPNGIGYIYINVQAGDDVSVEIEVADVAHNDD